MRIENNLIIQHELFVSGESFKKRLDPFEHRLVICNTSVKLGLVFSEPQGFNDSKEIKKKHELAYHQIDIDEVYIKHPKLWN